MLKTAFVTGGTGFVGSRLIERLRAERWRVVALVRSPDKARFLLEQGVELVEGDLSDAARLTRLLPQSVDAFFHVAANIRMWRGERERIRSDNVEGTLNVLDAVLARGGKRFVFTSSAAVWGLNGECFDEASPRRGARENNPYIDSKLEAERAVFAAAARGLSTVVLNPGHIVGAGDASGWGRSFLDLKAGRLFAAPPGAGTWTHVGSLVDAQLAAATLPHATGAYLLGGPVARYAEVIRLVAELLGVPPPARVAPSWFVTGVAGAQAWMARARGVAPDLEPELAELLCKRLEFRSTRAERELGYRPRSLRHMFEESHVWLCEQGLL